MGQPHVSYELTGAQYQEGVKWNYFIDIMYTTSTALIKCSISCFMLRIARNKLHLSIFKGVIGISIIACLIRVIYLLARCKRLESNWKMDDEAVLCTSSPGLIQITIFFSAVCIATDVVCAIIPGFIVYKLKMDRKTRAFVMAMLGIGAL